MKNSDKITLSFGQLKKLVKESHIENLREEDEKNEIRDCEILSIMYEPDYIGNDK